MLDAHITMTFANKYGVSIITNGNGGKQGLLELAVLHNTHGEWVVCYRTPITDSVIGWLTQEEAIDIAIQVEALTANERCGHIADRSNR